MDDLRRYIQTHPGDFEVDAPEGHSERFRKKLNHQHTGTFFARTKPFMKIAAIAVLVIISGMWILEHSGVIPESQHTNDQQITGFKEAEDYYHLQVNQKYTKLKHMQFIGDSLQKKILFKELSGMDSVYNNLQKDLKINPGDERIYQAMIEYYQTKLNALNTIIHQLSQLQKSKQTGHEKTNL